MKDPGADVRTVLIVQIVLFCTGSLRVAYDVSEAATMLFREGRTTSTCLQLRLLFEYWGACAFAGTLCKRVRDTPNLVDPEQLERVVKPINRLVAGSRIPVKLPRGGKSTATSYNVMKFIQHLEKCDPGTEKIYEFLCETCHPSFVQQSYLLMAGSEGDNWTNEKFREHAHTLLEQLISAGERAANGLAQVGKNVTEVSNPIMARSE